MRIQEAKEWVEASVEQAVKQASAQATKEAVKEVLSSLGIDAKDAREMQADMLFLRRMRLGSDLMRRRVLTTILTTIIGGTLWLLWESLQEVIRRPLS